MEGRERHCLPAAAAYSARAADQGALAGRLLAWQRHLSEHWHDARFGALRVETHDGRPWFTVEVELGGLDAEAVRVELFADPADGGEPLRQVVERARPPGGSAAGVYTASVPDFRPAGDVTPRLVAQPRGADAARSRPHPLATTNRSP